MLNKHQVCILELLRDGTEKKGLQLVKESEGKLKRGIVYIHLTQLVEMDYINSRPDNKERDDELILLWYSIKDNGRRALIENDSCISTTFKPQSI